MDSEVWMGLASELFVILAGSAIAYLAVLAHTWKAKSIARMESVMDEEARKRLEAALDNAIAYAESTAGKVSMEDVTDYLKKFNPGDLARGKLAGTRLTERVKAAVAKRRGTTSTTTSTSAPTLPPRV
jgi:hypothetical protein